MGTITAQAIADKAWTILQDTNGGSGVRWTPGEVLGWVNDGQREIVMVISSAFTKAVRAPLEAGTRQTLVGLGITDGLQLLRFTRNFAADGTTVGRVITKIAHSVLDQEMPEWHGASGPAVIHYTTDPQDPKAAYVWPAVDAGKKAEVIYSAVPTPIGVITGVISLDDIYANALQYYVMFRTLSKRTTGLAAAKQEAVSYYNLFLQVLGVKERITLAADQAQTVAGAQA